ncbi:ribonuclease P protein component [Thiomicrospira microaerophila]|uniref:ribonuclease P protein component n=1 Tax=Thiomicrospira microaerophila TaxID=406020 RepID=UPI0009FC6D1E|nr:ribonuclease P protein component [Thiomicrospira microaerophila]
MSFDSVASHALALKQPPHGLLQHDFPKSLRLLTPADFTLAFTDAQKFANRHWTLIVRANHLPLPRLGLAVSKKQLSRAVWRNRVKRIAREGFRQHKNHLCGYDIVVLGRRGMQDIDNQTLANSFFHLINKIANSDLKQTSVKE